MKLCALLFGALFAGAVWIYPSAGTVLPLVLVLYAIALLRSDRLWVLLLPICLPVLDLAPWTGWFFLEEIDLLLLLTLAIGYFRLADQAPRSTLPAPTWWAIGLLSLSYAISCVRGLFPFEAFSHDYNNAWNALRLLKPWCWALLLLPILRRSDLSLFPLGMLTGLALVSGAALWERHLFPGMLNFSTEYRSSAFFSSMHTGGAALDGYLALGIPLLLPYLSARRWWAWGLFALALFAALTSFSRGLYLAVIACALAYGVLRLAQQQSVRGLWRQSWRGLLLLGAISLPVLNGYYVKERIANVQGDFQQRQQHWSQVLGMMDNQLLGSGLGRYPATYFWRNTKRDLPPSMSVQEEQGNHFLHLLAPRYARGYGEVLRILQRVPVEARHTYVMSFDVRRNNERAVLDLRLCERQLLYPQNCLEWHPALPPPARTWQRISLPFNALGLDGAKWPLRAPDQLEISAVAWTVDVDNVSILDTASGQELLRNGSFSEQQDHWFFSSDRHHFPWHIKNLLLNQYFEQGALGLFALLALLSVAMFYLVRAQVPAALGLFGFLTVGIFDSLLDVPRISLILFLFLFSFLLGNGPAPSSPPGPRPS